MSKKNKVRDFKKVKLKVGRTLKKANATNTIFKSKQIVIRKQLEESAEVPSDALNRERLSAKESLGVSHRGLTLSELCQQLGHYNLNVRKDAIVELRQLFASNVHLIRELLYVLIPVIGRLIASEKRSSTLDKQLAAFIRTILLPTNSSDIEPHFPLLLAQVLRGLTKMNNSVKLFALSVADLIMRLYPTLCRHHSDLFDTYVLIIRSQRKLGNRQLMLDSLEAFMVVFGCEVKDKSKKKPLHEASLSFEMGTCTPINIAPKTEQQMYYPIRGLDSIAKSTPLETSDGLLRALEGISALLPSLIEDRSLSDEKLAVINIQLSKDVSRVLAVDDSAEFRSKVSILIRPLNVCYKANERDSRKFNKSVKLLMLCLEP